MFYKIPPINTSYERSENNLSKLTKKQEINDNERLSNLDKDIKRLQHQSCKNNDKAAKEEYLKLKEEFDNDPLIVNYQILYEEVNNLLKEIKQILE